MEGKLVRLRGYERSDLDAVMKWINDEEVTDFLGSRLTYPVSSIAEENFIEAAVKSSDTEKTFVIETIAYGKYIGAITFHAIIWLILSSDLGFVIVDKTYLGLIYG